MYKYIYISTRRDGNPRVDVHVELMQKYIYLLFDSHIYIYIWVSFEGLLNYLPIHGYLFFSY